MTIGSADCHRRLGFSLTGIAPHWTCEAEASPTESTFVPPLDQGVRVASASDASSSDSFGDTLMKRARNSPSS